MDIFDYMKDTSKEVDRYTLKFLSNRIKDRKIQQITSHLPKIMANRPKITATFGRLLYELIDKENNFKEILPIFASIELAHTSTYVLDDIIDNQSIRQSEKTTWSEFGLNFGIIAGSLQSFLSKLMVYDAKLYNEQILKISKLMDEMWTTLWIGEGKNEEMKEGTTLNEYIQRCYEIAGVMLSCTAKITAITCNKDDKEVQKMGKIGEYFGIGAMIRNDLMNILPQELIKKGGSRALLGHEYEDIRKGLWTFPIISAMKKSGGEEKKYINSILGKEKLTKEEITRLIEILIKCDAIEESLNLITKYKEKAKNIVNELFSGSTKKELLLNFLEQLENSRLYFKRLEKYF